MKTYTAKPADVKREWHIIDAADKTLGRLSINIARLLMGKHRPIYTPSQDTGDFVVVINADKVRVTGKKAQQKTYYRHSGYPGGLTETTAGKLLQEKPEEVLKIAVRGMLPKNTLGRAMLKKLKIYKGPEHPHDAQCPRILEL